MQHAAPARPLPVAALSALLALTAAACSTGGREADRPAATAPATVRSPAALPQATAGPLLTRAQARAALITEADLGGVGTDPGRGDLARRAAEGRRGAARLRSAAGRPLHRGPVRRRHRAARRHRPRRGGSGAQIHYRITSHRPADIDTALAWLGTLPDACGRFTARADRGAVRDVRVTGLTLPEAGTPGRACG
ncbi:hypothetical protein RBH85_17055 [Streptomyces rochei]|nr:hypothetical protein [Streptomyces rochei]WMI58320.1 hypothetical protein RBH85_17055 [Streptomyces rochei]